MIRKIVVSQTTQLLGNLKWDNVDLQHGFILPVLSASPRKGRNSDLLCDQFMHGVQEAGNQVEKIFLRDKKIKYCTGCVACQSNGGKCDQKDDVAEVLDKMITPDVIVIAAPVYFYT